VSECLSVSVSVYVMNERQDLKGSIVGHRKQLEFLLYCGHYLHGCMNRLDEDEEGEGPIPEDIQDIQDVQDIEEIDEGESGEPIEPSEPVEPVEPSEPEVEEVQPSHHLTHYHENFQHPHMAQGWYPIRTHQVPMTGHNDSIHIFVRYWNSVLRLIGESIPDLGQGEDQVHMIPMRNVVDFTMHAGGHEPTEGDIVHVEVHRGFISSSYFHALRTSENLVCRLWGSLGYHVLVMEVRDISRSHWATTLIHFNYYQYHGHFADRNF